MGLLDGILDAVGIGATGVPWGTIAQVGAGVLGFEGQESTNESNQNIAQNASAFNAHQAELARQFNSEQAGLARTYNTQEADKTRLWGNEQADKQMAFQERLANSAYQRATEDMQRAGLNPMLAALKGGAVTPGGAMGQGATASSGAASSPTASAAMIPMGNSQIAAMQSAGQAAQIDQTTATTERTKAESRRIDADTVRIAADTGRIEALRDNIRQEMQTFEQRMEKLTYETDKAHSDALIRRTDQRFASAKQNYVTAITDAELKKLQSDADRLRNMANLLGLEVPKAVAEAEHFTKYKGYHVNVGPFINDAGKITNSAAQGAQAVMKGRMNKFIIEGK